MLRLRWFYILFGLLLLLASACKEETTQEHFQYLFTGHTYDWGRFGRMDSQIEKLDLSSIDGVWHGGDILTETTQEKDYIKYIDGIIDLNNPLSHVAIGNHDARNGKRILNEYRGLTNSFYSSTVNSLCFFILDTTISPAECNELNEQWKLFQNVTDTVANSSHLILLMHDGVWDNVPGLPEADSYANGSQTYWNTNCNDIEQYFYNSIYPKLLDVEKRGVQVLCLMGDVGWKKGQGMQSTDGVDFIASGINNSYVNLENKIKPKMDRVVVFSHEPNKEKLTWEFVTMDSLQDYIDAN